MDPKTQDVSHRYVVAVNFYVFFFLANLVESRHK